MKKLFLMLSVGVVALAFAAPEAQAVPSFKDGFLAKYAEAAIAADAKKAGCNLCHVKGEKKTVRNVYGIALSKHIKKEQGKTPWSRADEAQKKTILDALEKAAAEKSENGQAFGDIIKAGSLPGGE